MKLLLLNCLICGFFLFSCSSSKFGWRDGSTENMADQNKMVEDFDPLTLGDDDIELPKPLDESNTSEPTYSEPAVNPIDSVVDETEMVMGFRVQLFATKDEEKARDERRSAIFKFQEKVYLEFESSMFKLRVGDCQSREEAETLRRKAVRNGFKDPWIVPSQIYRNNSN